MRKKNIIKKVKFNLKKKRQSTKLVNQDNLSYRGKPVNYTNLI